MENETRTLDRAPVRRQLRTQALARSAIALGMAKREKDELCEAAESGGAGS